MKRQHGLSRTPEYVAWKDIKRRCLVPKHIHYCLYGGRGIKVCARWMKFKNFLADVGKRPSSKHSIDRYPDNDGHYTPENVRWATSRQQMTNRRKTVRLKNGTPLIDEIERLNLNENSIRGRLKLGWSTERAINTAVRLKRKSLTKSEKRTIRKLYRSGLSQDAIATRFKIAQSAISTAIKETR